MFKKPDALIFDMDGTLWDAVATYALGWNAYFIENNMELRFSKAQLDGLMGLDQDTYLEKLLPTYPKIKRNEIYERVIWHQYQQIAKIGGTLYPGVVQGLEKLALKYRLFILSNCPRDTIIYFMRFAKIEHLITDSLANGQNFKPKYQNIQLLINKYNLQNPVYIGDTDSDALQSQKAGIPFVFMQYGFGKTENFAQTFASFDEFTAFYLQEDIKTR